MGKEAITINSDGGGVLVNGEEQKTMSLAAGDIIKLGSITELVVDRLVPGVGVILLVQDGPEKGRKLAFVGESVRLNWLTASERPAGKLQWQNKRPQVHVAGSDNHPVFTMQDRAVIHLLDGDILHVDHDQWRVKLL